MRILFLNWKDKKNPLAGGAEIVTEELLKRLADNGHRATLLTARFKGCKTREIIDGYEIIRVGGGWSVYWRAYRYYKKNLAGKFDLVIDEVNTIPFFAKFYVKGKNILFIHQLCREIWFYQMFFPLNFIGYLAESIYLRLLRDKKVVTVSDSTKKDLLKYGFREENIYIISEGIEIEPLGDLPPAEEIKEKNPTILFLGAVRPMKRPDHVIRAFERAKQNLGDLKLWLVGGGRGRYFKKVMGLIKDCAFRDDIIYFGKAGQEKKIELMRRAHLSCAASVKEGWGLVVTEANSQGTPAVVYDVDGLRDAVENNITGAVCFRNTPEDLAENVRRLLNDRDKYENLRINAWRRSQEINFENSYEDFLRAIID